MNNLNPNTKANSGYRWRDKDPILYLIIALIAERGMSDYDVAAYSGVSYSTIRNWTMGKTRKPQAVTVKFVLRALGYELAIHDIKGGRLISVPISEMKLPKRRNKVPWRTINA